MAGAIAALSAKKAGANVLLVRRALGATAMSSGAIDVAADPASVAGDVAALGGSWMDAAREMARRLPAHPYAVLEQSLARLPEALQFAHEALYPFLSKAGERNALLPTPVGTVKPSAMAQASQIDGDLHALPDTVAVLELVLTPAWDAQLIARGLEDAARSMGRTLTAHVVKSTFFRSYEDALRTPYELAARLDNPAAVDELAEELVRLLPKGTGTVIVPPIFGRTSLAASRLQTALGVQVAELLSTAPSVPGLRLQDALDAALRRAGILLKTGDVTRKDGRLSIAGEVELAKVPMVLATGKYIGGGIERHTVFRERIFDLPVFAGERHVDDIYVGDLLSPTYLEPQQAFRVGVRIDSALRPLDVDGKVVREDLFAAGSVIRGYDAAADKTGLGVAIFTGFLAGENAARS